MWKSGHVGIYQDRFGGHGGFFSRIDLVGMVVFSRIDLVSNCGFPTASLVQEIRSWVNHKITLS